MKLLITFLFLTSVAFAIRHDEDKLVLPKSSQVIFTNQQIQLQKCSFSPLYLYVFEVVDSGPVKHLNLTDQLQGEVMRIESFELLEDMGIQTWVAYLKRKDDDKLYVCELEEAIISKEIKILNRP